MKISLHYTATRRTKAKVVDIIEKGIFLSHNKLSFLRLRLWECRNGNDICFQLWTTFPFTLLMNSNSHDSTGGKLNEKCWWLSEIAELTLCIFFNFHPFSKIWDSGTEPRPWQAFFATDYSKNYSNLNLLLFHWTFALINTEQLNYSKENIN